MNFLTILGALLAARAITAIPFWKTTALLVLFTVSLFVLGSRAQTPLPRAAPARGPMRNKNSSASNKRSRVSKPSTANFIDRANCRSNKNNWNWSGDN
jgi:hypothetical protein